MDNSFLYLDIIHVDDIQEIEEALDEYELSYFEQVILGSKYTVLKGSVKVYFEDKEDIILSSKMQSLLQKTIDSWYYSWHRMHTSIPSAPVNIPNYEVAGLKNLAAWIARYHSFGLAIAEVSPYLTHLSENGKLAQFEPSLVGLEAGYSGGEDEYQRYEFDVEITDIVHFNNDWVNLHFSFLSRKCEMYAEIINQSKDGRLSLALENIFNVLEVEPLSETNNFFRDITWQEADEIILKYLKYMGGSVIPSLPE